MADNFYTGAKPLSKEDIKTVQFDARFPNTNQTKACWQNYVDFHKCVKQKGSDYQPCRQFLSAYLSLCPVDWIQKWDEQRENNVFPFPAINADA
eukprot:m.285917 g.285917  ORF g.285917 m.285917 type:complete len:94 (+) comp11475_c0_seq1:59-340(+)